MWQINPRMRPVPWSWQSRNIKMLPNGECETICLWVSHVRQSTPYRFLRLGRGFSLPATSPAQIMNMALPHVVQKAHLCLCGNVMLLLSSSYSISNIILLSSPVCVWRDVRQNSFSWALIQLEFDKHQHFWGHFDNKKDLEQVWKGYLQGKKIGKRRKLALQVMVILSQ